MSGGSGIRMIIDMCGSVDIPIVVRGIIVERRDYVAVWEKLFYCIVTLCMRRE